MLDVVGHFFMVGFDGIHVTEEVRNLITEYRVRSFILSGRNFANADQARQLIRKLQLLALEAKYRYPILFVIDEEGGMLNSLFDKNYITQFPGAMALGATGSTELVYQVYRAVAKELKSIGFSMFLGPVLDILKNTSHTLIQEIIGVRSYGYDVETVIKYGKVAAQAFRDENMFNCGKHFPGYGSATVNSNFELPMIYESTNQLLNFNLVPYMELIKEDLLDGVSVGGCAVPGVNTNDLHACLSQTIVTKILRDKLQFKGVVISECLLLEALDRNFGVVQGCISAFSVGCDFIMLCNNFEIQKQSILALQSVIEDQIIDSSVVESSLARIKALQEKMPSWPEVLEQNPFLSPDTLYQHKLLSKKAYQNSITVIRDAGLPITKYLKKDIENENSILILTPIISPLYEIVDAEGHRSHANNIPNRQFSNLELHYGEDVFIEFGKGLAECKPGYKVYHTSYNSNGLTSFHEELISKSKVILFFSAETTSNLYQVGVSKHVSMLCGSSPHKTKKTSNASHNKQMIIISVSSPTDFLYDINIGGSPTGYICTYDYTLNALSNLPRILFGDVEAVGVVPGLKPKLSSLGTLLPSTPKYQTHSWLVESFDFKRDWHNLVNLLRNNGYLDFSIDESSLTSLKRLFFDNESHKSFVVRNTSSKTILGISVTWIYNNSIVQKDTVSMVGNLLFLLVDKNKRNISIGNHLYTKTMKYFFEEQKCKKVYLGRNFPKLTMSNDLLLEFSDENSATLKFFKVFGWDFNNDIYKTKVKGKKSLKRKRSLRVDLKNEERISISTLLVDDTNNEEHEYKYGDFKHRKNIGLEHEETAHESEPATPDNKPITEKTFAAKLLNRPIQRQIKYAMKLSDVSDWQVAENLVRQLQVVGIMFDICQNPTDIFLFQKNKNLYGFSENLYEYDDSNQLSEFSNNNYEIYLELYKDYCAEGKKQYLDGSSNLNMIVALEPTKRAVVGSLVVFNESSKFLKFYPFLQSLKEKDKTNTKTSPGFVCITGNIIDPLYTTLSEVFKLGLICTALMYVKTQCKNCSECYLMDVDEKQIRSLKDNGFVIINKYYNYYSVIFND